MSTDYKNEFKIEMLQFNKNVGLITEHESKVFEKLVIFVICYFMLMHKRKQWVLLDYD
jgi:hypothetical protein